MKNTTMLTALLISCAVTHTFSAVKNENNPDKEKTIFNDPMHEQEIEEKHASFHVEEITIDDNYDNNDYDREKIADKNLVNKDVQEEDDDEFLDDIADELATAAPHPPRHNPTVIETVIIVAKIAKNITADFVHDIIKPTLISCYHTIKKAFPGL